MSYTSISANDPWPDACPSAYDLDDEELLAFLQDWPCAPLTQWERNFCVSLESQLLQSHQYRYWRGLSPKQLAVLDRGLLKILWDNDPALWR